MPATSAELSYASLGGQPIVSIRSAIEAFTENGWDLSLFIGKANSFTTSIGEEPGHGFVLMARAALDSLNTSSPLHLIFGQGGSDESIDLNGVYVRSATRITPGASQDDNAIYLVEVVDTRYYLRRKLVDKRYNCRYLRDTSNSYVTATLNSGVPWTWSQVITDLWNANSTLIGSIGTLPDLTDLTSTPENLRYEGVSAWEALNDVCRRCGCTVVLDNAFVNNFYVVRLGVISGDPDPSFFSEGGTKVTKAGVEATFSSDPTSRPTAGGDGLIVDKEVLQGDSMIPKTIVVMFPTEFGSGQLRNELESTYGKWYAVKIDGSDSSVLPYHIACEFHDAPGDANRIPRPTFNSGSELIRYELATARFSTPTDVDPSNKTTITTRAKEVARDIYRTIHDCSFAHAAYMGIKYGDDANVIIPGKTLTTVSWGDFGQGFRTDFYRRLPRLLPDEPFMVPQPGGGSGTAGAPRIRFTILATSFTVGLGALGCDNVTVRVNHISCSGTGVSVGDEVLVYDPEYCYFNLPIDLLVGLSGTATLMNSDSYQPGLDYILDCLYDIRTAGCIWMIDTLCCSEEEFIGG